MLKFLAMVVSGVVLGIVLATILFEPRSKKTEPKVTKTIEGLASFYGRAFDGKCMADGRIFDKEAPTAAHLELPLGTFVRVTYKGRSVVLEITDRGPYVTGREIDLSEGAARRLGFLEEGVVPVTIEVLGVPKSGESKEKDPACQSGSPPQSEPELPAVEVPSAEPPVAQPSSPQEEESHGGRYVPDIQVT